MQRTIPAKFVTRVYRSLFWRIRKLSLHIETRLMAQNLADAGIPHVHSIHSYTEEDELRTLYYLASSCPVNASALEIGSYLGASTCYLAAGLIQVGGHLYCADTWHNETMPEGTRETFSEFLNNTRRIRHVITPIRKRSCELTSRDIQLPLNFVFIDGDHSYEAVKSDFTLVKDWLSADGVIAFHDFGHSSYEGVSRVLCEALSSGEWNMSGWVNTLTWIRPAPRSQPQWLGNQAEMAGKP